jgi:small subunit ribosomal protein S13
MSSDFKYIVRMFGTDIDGNRPIMLGLTDIRGVGLGVATSIVRKLDLDKNRKMGELTDQEVEALSKVVQDPISAGIPSWKVNRRKDFDTGRDLHLNTSQLMMAEREDVNRLKRIRSYRGIRHERGLKVRGQRTRSTGRRGSVVGVKKKKGGGIIRKEGPSEE